MNSLAYSHACLNLKYRYRNGKFNPGTSNTMYLTFLQSSSLGYYLFVMDTNLENWSLSNHNSPSKYDFGQPSTKNLGKFMTFPFLEYIFEPVQIILIPSNFSLK